LTLFYASSAPGGSGGLDIWMATPTATAIPPTWNGDVIGKEQNKDGSNHMSQIALIRKLYDARGNVWKREYFQIAPGG
jgi:hypothetical protein